MSVAHKVPYDILALIADAGGKQTAVRLAMTCHALKRVVDQRFINKQNRAIRVSDLFDSKGDRKIRHVGKFTHFSVKDPNELKYIPNYTTVLFLSVDTGPNFEFPPGLEQLFISGMVSVLPQELFGLSLDWKTPFPTVSLPTSLKYFCFSLPRNRSLDDIQLPHHLEDLVVDGDISQPFTGVNLPQSLRILEFRGHFDQPLDHIHFPKGLRYLHLGRWFRHPIDRSRLPSDLEIIEAN